MTRHLPLALSAGLLISLICLSFWQQAEIEAARRQPPYYESDQDYITEAINLWATKNRENHVAAVKNRYPVSVHFRDTVCIELRLKLGSVGGNPTYCFNRKTLRLVYKYDEVE